MFLQPVRSPWSHSQWQIGWWQTAQHLPCPQGCPALLFFQAVCGLLGDLRSLETCRNSVFLPSLVPSPQKNKHSHCQEPWGLAMRNRCLPETYGPCSAAWGHHLGAGKGSGSRAHPPCAAPRVQPQGQQPLFVIGDCTLLHPTNQSIGSVP